MTYNEIKKCRICRNESLISLLDLGMQPSGRFPSSHEESSIMRAPLKLVKCDDLNSNNCGLLQLAHNVDPGEMYGETYGYRSGLNQTMIENLTDIVKGIESRINLDEGDVVLDIGSSDATLLKAYPKQLKKIGIDPAAAKFSSFYTEDMILVPDFFTSEIYEKHFPDKKAKVVSSIAMFYDLPDPVAFVRDIKKILHPEGIWVCEQSYMPKMLETNSFDTVCHEHLEYYSLKQLEWILEKNDMKILDVEFNDINGGSFRVYSCHKNSKENQKQKVEEIRTREKNLKLDTLKPYKEFEQRIKTVSSQLKSFIMEQKSSNKRIHVYGASTKGNVLLNFLSLDNFIIEAAADRNPYKWGKVTPGTKIPIISEEESRKSRPDYYLVLPWHFKKEFIKREKEFLNSGGKLIFPLPNIEVIGKK